MRLPATLLAIALTAAVAHGQTQPDLRPAEQVFKNIQALKGIPANQFMATMGFFTASLGESCNYCHVDEAGGNWDRYADDNDHKRAARRMIAMVSAITKNYFNGRRALTCYSCHRGNAKPEITPDLALVYSPGHYREPDQLLSATGDAPAVDQIWDKYIQALGGAQRLGGLTRFRATGTYQGYAVPKRSLELFADGPTRRTTIVHGDNGDTSTTYDGREGWIASPSTDMPVPVLELTGGDLDGAKLDAVVAFPSRMRQTLSQWRVGAPAEINDREVNLLQASLDGRYPINLYFDGESGLLVRTVRYSDSPVGLAPTQVDYSDYREVAGVKMPFKWSVTWLDGRSTIVLSEVEPNAAIEASRFARPKSAR